ncbi:nucleotidyltransferase [Mesorhizobium sp. WSM4935]|uniref:SMODS domain-containing nucleotidyltransferase n=1 Tax=Mesorhizobium sp. WSM4935 TaxID=3038547 RepID=UPI002415668E|nr:nucleotidyltransferase [Mesorhizobium sp. WSM4935]MDG4875218.1 nucleotidyltransferase [Mesorhizobium sp. WSM4935]
MTASAYRGKNPFEDPLDRILAEIAFSVQLPPSLHAKACQRYKAVREYLEGTTSFQDQIEHFYAQGSMAIDATISTRGTDDEYDIDIVAQLGGRYRNMTPLAILNALAAALRDYPVQKIVQQTRCVTLFYADDMHLDVTPALRHYGTIDRQSAITHAKGPQPSNNDYMVPMNAYGHAEWYRARTPNEERVIEAFKDRWFGDQRVAIRAEAEVDEVPDQTEFVVKSMATVALQLLKRHRNVRYANYKGRIPPSVMLSYFAGAAALPDMKLTDMLIRICRWIIGEIERASINRRKLHVVNPTYSADVFTDRWPENLDQQDQFARYLQDLVAGIERAKRGEFDPVALRDWLREIFGERVVTRAADRMADATGAAIVAGSQVYSKKGSILLPAAAAIITSAAPVAAKPHTFFGDPVDE